MIERVKKILEEMDFDREFICESTGFKSYTYNNFFYHAYQLAEYIDSNVESDSIIAIKDNSIELALLYFAVMMSDKRICVADPLKGHQEIFNIIKDIEKTAIFLDKDNELTDLAGHTLLEYPKLDDYDGQIDIKGKFIESICSRKSDDPYLVTFTSGTSGNTKGVEHSLDSLFLTALALHDKVGKTGGSFIHVMPMTYMAGILNSLFYPFLVNSRIIIARRFSIVSARSFWKTVIDYDVDLFWLSPSMLMMIDQIDRKHDGEQYCRNRKMTFLIGTAALTDETRKRFNERYGVEVFASYGLSETLFVSVETERSLKESKPGSVGELLDGVDYRFSENGEMYINVPWMFLRYTNENTAEYFDGNYYKSGDLTKVENGFLYITGRNKDIIVKGGINISPVLIESVINKDENILENVVIGVKDKTGEEKICCAYKLRNPVDDISEFESALKKMTVKQLGANYSIDYMWNVREITRNINGKIDKKKMAELWREENYE